MITLYFTSTRSAQEILRAARRVGGHARVSGARGVAVVDSEHAFERALGATVSIFLRDRADIDDAARDWL